MNQHNTPTPDARCDTERLLAALSQEPSLAELCSLPISTLLSSKPSAAPLTMSCDISLPPIVLLLSSSQYHLLTGHDQLNKAHVLGFSTIDCLIVSPKVYARFAESVGDEVRRS